MNTNHKIHRFVVAATLILILLGACAPQNQIDPQAHEAALAEITHLKSLIAQAEARAVDAIAACERAAEGDGVILVINRVKADRWAQHQEIVLDRFYPAVREVRSIPDGSTRALFADEKNDDGTYTSIFIIDPVLSDTNYLMSDIVAEYFGQAQGEVYIDSFLETLARDQEVTYVIQSPW